MLTKGGGQKLNNCKSDYFFFNIVLFKDPPTLKPSNKTTVREGTSDVRLFCDVVTDGNPAKYSNLIWQHWIGNTFIRKLDPDNLPNGSPIKTFSLTMQSVRIN